jgi:hypothetical protein
VPSWQIGIDLHTQLKTTLDHPTALNQRLAATFAELADLRTQIKTTFDHLTALIHSLADQQ